MAEAYIPAAASAPTSENVNPDGTFRSCAELAARFRELGATPGRPVGTYCGSGVTAAHEVLALTLAGVPAALYLGSWSGLDHRPGPPRRHRAQPVTVSAPASSPMVAGVTPTAATVAAATAPATATGTRRDRPMGR